MPISTMQPVVHQERQSLAAWVWALIAALWVSVIVSAWAVWHGWSAAPPAERNLGDLIGVLIGPAVMAIIHALLGGIRITVRQDQLTVELRYWPIPVRIPVPTIRACRPVTYSPLRKFGGWGVRGSWSGIRAYTARGNRGLLLYLDGERRALLGSDDPEALAAVLGRLGIKVLAPTEDVEAPV
jgi:xanthosine utilization system XapX-like protein